MKALLLLPVLALAGAAAALVPVVPVVQDEKPEPVLPSVGAAAPAFRLNDHAGRAVAIGGEAPHWTVLAFFPKAATPG